MLALLPTRQVSDNLRLRGIGERRPGTRVISSEPAAAPDRVRGEARYLSVAYGTGGFKTVLGTRSDARIHELPSASASFEHVDHPRIRASIRIYNMYNTETDCLAEALGELPPG